MKYYICEGKPDGEYNASSKARKDVEVILNDINITPFYIPTEYGVQEKKILKYKQIISYYKNYKIWKKKIKEFNKNDILIIQYPLINTVLNFEKIICECKKKEIVTIMLIHDLDSLRSPDMPRKVKEDKKVLNESSFIIAHNSSMKEKLRELGNAEEKIINLEIFDYIYDKEIKTKIRNKQQPIIIAGNLSKEKAKYLQELKNVKDIEFNLYGKGYEKSDREDNVFYKGAFLPEELINNLEGSFGLVWDGTSKDTCEGNFGKYLKYNNPHKTSLYLTAKLPVIVWKESAMAEFIEKNKVGIAVEKLDDINKVISKISDEEYENMIKNTEIISKRLKEGYYLKQAIEKVFTYIEGK